MKKRIFPLLFLTCLGIFSLSGCSRMTKEENPEKKEQKTKEQLAPEVSSETDETEENTPDTVSPTVYMTTDISSDGLMKVYQALRADSRKIIYR